MDTCQTSFPKKELKEKKKEKGKGRMPKIFSHDNHVTKEKRQMCGKMGESKC